MYVDSHCHLDRLDLGPFGGDFSALVAETKRMGVEQMLCVGIDLETYPAMRALVDSYSNVWVSVGVHPNESNCREPTVETLLGLAADDKVVAIGETGLDNFRADESAQVQQGRFRTHIRAAKACNKPLIVHCREASEDTLRLLREEGADEVGGVFHCFTENWEVARQALDLNFHISFSGILTFKNAQVIQDAAKKVPEDRILIETDAPYLAPVPFRGKPNYPFHVGRIAEFLADLRGVSVREMADATRRNFHALFSTGSM